MGRSVRGSLFSEYVRMIRARKDVEWDRLLTPEDVGQLKQFIDDDAWYCMGSFERMGNAILVVIAEGNVGAARMWGHMSADHLAGTYPDLVVRADAMDTLMRFRVLRSTFFDFDALQVHELQSASARIEIDYGMGDTAEEAASHQTMGFFERVLTLAGATEVEARFAERSWAGDPRTILELEWKQPA